MISLVFFYELFVIFNYRMTKKGKIGKAIKKKNRHRFFFISKFLFFFDCFYWTLSCTCATAYTSVCNYVCHNMYPPFHIRQTTLSDLFLILIQIRKIYKPFSCFELDTSFFCIFICVYFLKPHKTA